MKKAEEYLKLIHAKDFNPSSLGEAIKLVIKQAQIDAIKETCEECAESSSWEYADCRHDIPDFVPYVGDNEYGYNYIDKKSILSVADKLIKELEDGSKD